MRSEVSQKYILEDQELDEGLGIFHIHRPSFLNWLGIITVAFLLNFMYLVATGFMVTVTTLLVITGLSTLTWDKLGKKITDSLISSAFRLRTVEQPSMRESMTLLMLKLVGLQLRRDRTYYLEGYIPDLELRGRKAVTDAFRSRYIDVVSACFGIVLLLMVPLQFQQVMSGETLFATFFLMLLISPVFVFWIVPLIWTVEDAGIREVDDRRVVRDLVDHIKHGTMNRFLGLAGILGAITYMYSNAEKLYEYLFESKPTSSFDKGAISVTMVIFMFLMVGGTVFLISMLYLCLFHEKRVNSVRVKLMDEVPVGITVIREANLAELGAVRNTRADEDLQGEDDEGVRTNA